MRTFLVALFCAPAAALAVGHPELAARHAPVILQETHDDVKDLLSAFDFDGNWNGADNGENLLCFKDESRCVAESCRGQGCPLVATVYYSVAETPTHFFIQYMPYHPLDWKLTNGHEHDTESILMVVRKDGGTGALELMEVRFHSEWFDYAEGTGISAGAGNIDGPVHREPSSQRVLVYSQMVGHGLCGGYSPPNRLFPDLQLTCNHAQAPHLDQEGVVYRPDLPAIMPVVVANQSVEVGYVLVELKDSIWRHIHEIGADKAFKEAVDFTGDRCSTLACPTGFGGAYNGDQGSSPAHAWWQDPGAGASGKGSQFFDPAYTMSRRLTFPAPFSLDYCWNPYVGVETGCDVDGGPPWDAGFLPYDAGVDPPDAAIMVDAAVPADAGADAAVLPSDAGTDASTVTPDSGAVTSTDAGSTTPAPAQRSCTCRETPLSAPWALLLAALASRASSRERRAARRAGASTGGR